MIDLSHVQDEDLKACIESCMEYVEVEGSQEQYLTLLSLLRFAKTDLDPPAPSGGNPIKDAVARTGAYYFGPMFSMDKGTSVPSKDILAELKSCGFFVPPLVKLNNAQLNLLFVTLKSLGIVSDKSFVTYVRYGT